MKINNLKMKDFIFDYIYMICALIYIIGMPVITLYLWNAKAYYPDDIASVTNKFSLVLAALVFVVFIADMFIRKKIRDLLKKRKVIIIFLLFIIWCTISTFLSSDFDKSFYGVSFRYSGLIQYISYISFAIIGFSLTEKTRNLFFRIFVFISLIIGLLTLFRNEISFIKLPVSYDFCGIFFNINHYGYYILYTTIISMFLFFEDRNIILKVVDVLVYSFFVYILILNNTFGCYIALFFFLLVLFIYLFKKKRKILYVFVIVPFIILSIFTKIDGSFAVRENVYELIDDINDIINAPKAKAPIDSYDNPVVYVGTFRGALWIHGAKYSVKKPFFGYGLENLAQKYMEDNIPMDMPHNLLLQLALTVGFPGMILYIAGLLIVLISGLKRIKIKNHLTNLCFFLIIAHLVSAMFGVTLYYVTSYFIIFLGMAIRWMRGNA